MSEVKHTELGFQPWSFKLHKPRYVQSIGISGAPAFSQTHSRQPSQISRAAITRVQPFELQ